MRKPLYIFSSGKLLRKENTLVLDTEESKKVIPINAVSEIKIFGEIEVNKREKGAYRTNQQGDKSDRYLF